MYCESEKYRIDNEPTPKETMILLGANNSIEKIKKITSSVDEVHITKQSQEQQIPTPTSTTLNEKNRDISRKRRMVETMTTTTIACPSQLLPFVRELYCKICTEQVAKDDLEIFYGENSIVVTGKKGTARRCSNDIRRIIKAKNSVRKQKRIKVPREWNSFVYKTKNDISQRFKKTEATEIPLTTMATLHIDIPKHLSKFIKCRVFQQNMCGFLQKKISLYESGLRLKCHPDNIKICLNVIASDLSRMGLILRSKYNTDSQLSGSASNHVRLTVENIIAESGGLELKDEEHPKHQLSRLAMFYSLGYTASVTAWSDDRLLMSFYQGILDEISDFVNFVWKSSDPSNSGKMLLQLRIQMAPICGYLISPIISSANKYRTANNGDFTSVDYEMMAFLKCIFTHSAQAVLKKIVYPYLMIVARAEISFRMSLFYCIAKMSTTNAETSSGYILLGFLLSHRVVYECDHYECSPVQHLLGLSPRLNIQPILGGVADLRKICISLDTSGVEYFVPLRYYLPQTTDFAKSIAENGAFLKRILKYINSKCPPGMLLSKTALETMSFSNHVHVLHVVSLLSTLLTTVMKEPDLLASKQLNLMIRIIRGLRNVMIYFIDMRFSHDDAIEKTSENFFATQQYKIVVDEIAHLLQVVYRKDILMKFLPNEFWIDLSESIDVSQAKLVLLEGKPGKEQFMQSWHTAGTIKYAQLNNLQMRGLYIITNVPFLVPYPIRRKAFQELIRASKSENLSETITALKIKRESLYYDTFDALTAEDAPNMRSTISVSFESCGREEIGLDLGGLLRDLLSEVMCAARCIQRRARFIRYHIRRIIYEGLLMECSFAHFVYIQLLDSRVKSFSLRHLEEYDEAIYKIFLFILDCSAEELNNEGYFFPDNTAVTIENRDEFVQLSVNNYLHEQVKPMIYELRRGVEDVFPLPWFQIFNPTEMQMLITGSAGFVVDDMKKYCTVESTSNSSGMSIEEEAYVATFWQILHSMTDEEKSKFLRFLTGYPRLLAGGFKKYKPPMKIILTDGSNDGVWPSSATCKHILYLPLYQSDQDPAIEKLNKSLLLAISLGKGFELA